MSQKNISLCKDFARIRYVSYVLVTSKACADKYDVKRALSPLAGFAWHHAYYRGINVDAKVSGDSEVKFWTRGHNIWTDGYESHYEQGTAVIM